MTRAELEHLLRAAADITNDDAIVVIGSQAILGQFPDAPETLRVSVEADLFPLPEAVAHPHVTGDRRITVGEVLGAVR